MPCALIYLRCVGKDEPSAALERERSEATAYFVRELLPQGFELSGVVLDSHAARRKPLCERRHGRAMSLSLQHGDCVLMPTLTAFADLADAIRTWDEWSHRGVRLIVQDIGLDSANEAGWQLLNALKALDGAGKRWKGEQVHAGLATRRQRGKLITGNAPIGMRMRGRRGHKRLVEDKDARQLMGKIYELRESGQTFEEIHATLWMGKVRRPDGTEISEPAIRRWYFKERALREQEALAASPNDAASPADDSLASAPVAAST